MIYDLIVIGGGAAGYFGAINTAISNPKFKILIIEKNNKVLQKVKVSGGGRCNVTNGISNPKELIKNYPRGGEKLEKPFEKFNTIDTRKWFENQGVKLKIEKDGRVFPTTNDSQTVIDCFENLCKRHKIELLTSCSINNIEQKQENWKLTSSKNDNYECRNLLIATGSSNAMLKSVSNLGVRTIPQTPSLFTFTTSDESIKTFSGISFPKSSVTIQNSEFKMYGPLLITHWGFSGPVILKLSSMAAIDLEAKAYHFHITINWIGNSKEEVDSILREQFIKFPKKQVLTSNPFDLPTRIWKHFCDSLSIREFQNWAETGKKQLNKLSSKIISDHYEIIGKSTFKEEFVSAGGIDLNELTIETFEHIRLKNLYFAGEILNIDGFTGGFNFQSAWTTSWIAANSIK